MSIEDLVKEAVDDLVQAVPPRSGLADVALRRAARRKHAARLAVAGGTAIAVAAGVPLGMAVLPDSARPPTRTDQTQAAVPSERKPTPKTVNVDIDKLKQGPPPAVPWSKNGDAYAGDTRLAGPSVEGHESPKVRKVEGGYAIEAYGRTGGVYLLKDGQRIPLSDQTKPVGGLVVSADGRQIAWKATEDRENGQSTLYVADVGSGEITHQKQTTWAQIGGFLSDDEILVSMPKTGDQPDGAGRWDLQANTITPWAGSRKIEQIMDVSRSGELALLSNIEPDSVAGRATPGGRPEDVLEQFEECREVVETATEKTLWKACGKLEYGHPELMPVTFSPDGKHVLGTQSRNPVVIDVRDGKPVLTLKVTPGMNRNAVWESDQSIVFTVWKDKHRSALVRCTIAGECELASPVTTFEKGWENVEHEGYWPYATLR